MGIIAAHEIITRIATAFNQIPVFVNMLAVPRTILAAVSGYQYNSRSICNHKNNRHFSAFLMGEK